jgi:hypothetical protein
VARTLFDRLASNEIFLELSLQPRVVSAKNFEVLDFNKEQVALCLFSTTGDGWLDLRLKLLHVLVIVRQ